VGRLRGICVVSKRCSPDILSNYIICHVFCSFLYPKWVNKNLLVSGTVVAQWLRCCATNMKVAGSIPDGVSGFFIDVRSFRSHYGHGFDSAANRNEYQEYFLGVKAADA